MKFVIPILYGLSLLSTTLAWALPAITYPIPIGNIQDFNQYPTSVKSLILTATQLTQQKLTYLYGSANPKNGGMDCSGTIYYLLHTTKLKDIPRQSDEMYTWVEKKGKLYKTNNQDFNSLAFANLKPGDLLFWSGTYNVNRSITHVMLYLGENNNHEPLMFGASDGRRYQGKRIRGVSVFDFKLPSGQEKARFVGYGCIPNLTCNA